MKRSIKKFTCAILATVSAFGCAATLTACETAHPKVAMEISFNGETYEVEYKLYRKTAPATVEHFLYLAGNGYYDGLCVHDYDDERMYAGEYSAVEGGELSHKNYYQAIAAFDNYDKFPHSVWEGSDKTSPTYTLKGEFGKNNFEVESGAIKESFGSLATYYYDGEDEAEDMRVYSASASEEGKTNRGVYQNNLATSAFFISLKTTQATNDDYCTFATVTDEGKEALEALQAAIEEYASENYDEEEFTHELTKSVFEYDPFLKEFQIKEEFDVPKEPIVIKKVKVVKY